MDPSGMMGTADLGTASAGEGILSSIATPNIGIQVNYAAGKAFEGVVEKQLLRFIAEKGTGQLFKQVYVKGPGGRRFVDFVLKMGDRLIFIEAKTKIPYGGSALVRLAGQLKTYLNPNFIGQGLGSGTVTEVIVVTEESVIAAEANFARIAAQLETGSMGPVLSGSVELMGILRNLLIGF